MEYITAESYKTTQQQGRKVLQYKDVANAVNDVDSFEFLTGNNTARV